MTTAGRFHFVGEMTCSPTGTNVRGTCSVRLRFLLVTASRSSTRSKSSRAHLTASRLPGLYVTFDDSVNEVGVEQRACTLCGNCVTGCNESSKNTVLMNYLPDAVHHGAEIYADRCRHRRATRPSLLARDVQRDRFGANLVQDVDKVRTREKIVVLAAGTLGSTEIMLRSAQGGLAVSDELGKRFSGNGDVVAFAFDSDHFINSVGWRRRTTKANGPPGPTITGMIDLRERTGLGSGMVIEDVGAPGPLGPVRQGGWRSPRRWKVRKRGSSAASPPTGLRQRPRRCGGQSVHGPPQLDAGVSRPELRR